MDIVRALFSFQGRLNRAQYALVLLVAYIGPLIVLVTYGGSFRGDGGLIGFGLVVWMLWVLFAALSRRFHDIEQSGWMSLLVIVPVVGALTPFAMLFMRGTEGANTYGPPP
jgi:uncharacterized membrane protein YhaH (DUF805 family)